MSVWGTALWGVDRWAVLRNREFLQQRPVAGRGVLTGLGDWRLCVEILLPVDALSLWGVARWDEETWTTLGWADLTADVRGLRWERGQDEPYGRPRVGTLDLTLDNNDTRFSPWNPTPPAGTGYFSPGTMIRVSVHSDTDTRAAGWLPQFTGFVSAWSESYADPTGADVFVDVTAVETLRDLAEIDDNALAAPVGAGEGAEARIERLLDAAAWRHGLLVEAQNLLDTGGYTLQATDMADNRLAECYLVADSTDVTFRTDRTGAAILTNPERVGDVGAADPRYLPLADFSTDDTGLPTIGFAWHDVADADLVYAPYIVDSFKSAPDDTNIVNDARLAAVGGTQQISEEATSIAKYGRRSFVRSDLLNEDDADVAVLAGIVTTKRALNVLRVRSLAIAVTDRGDDIGLACLAADVGNAAEVYPPSQDLDDLTPPHISGHIASVAHYVTPRNPAEVTWTAVFSIDTRTVHNLPAAQLPTSA